MKIIAVVFENFRMRKDKSILLSFSTNLEQSPDEVREYAQVHQKEVFLAIKENDFSNDEKQALETLNADVSKIGKSHSQRLRSVFFLLWNQDNEGFDRFTAYYDSKMEKLIEFYKSKIDES